MDINHVVIDLDDNIKALMDERGIVEDDIKEVLEYAENEMKLLEEGSSRSLGKKRLGEFTVYVEYTAEEDKIKVENVYSHRVTLTEDEE